jgi:hypothetical protein
MTTNPTATHCACGCEYFVWWIYGQGRYSSETPWTLYDRQRHYRAVCRDCSSPVPRADAGSETRKETT